MADAIRVLYVDDEPEKGERFEIKVPTGKWRYRDEIQR